MNRLSRERSPYLRHAAKQKINWYPWSDEPFSIAKEENKPVFLSSGAIWCHWCHVMAKECFEDDEIASLLNDNFINIKLDRDERPDIDRRYQQAVSAMGFGGGWPLSVFLTPEKAPFFGGTYFPPEDRLGRPGFKNVLRTIADFYKTKRKYVAEYSQKLIAAIKPKSLLAGEIKESILTDAVNSILSQFDHQNGGFGKAPKFSMPGAIEFLMNRYFFTQSETIGLVIKKTLESMAKGGFHDQIGGGFHRYAIDEAWIIPHYEKMADDNAWLLRNYLNGYSLFGFAYFKEVAKGIINFIDRELSSPEGGFYASQDADVTPDDEGGYFTWKDEEFRSVLTDREYQVMSLHLLHQRGSMHHNAAKKVLFISMDIEDIAQKSGIDVQTVSHIIQTGKEKLLKERLQRDTPFIDRTLYTSLNGMLISSYLKAFRVLKDKHLKDFSLKSLKKIMKIHFTNNKLFHTQGIKALLDDYIHIIDALIASYEVTGDSLYLDQAETLMELCIKSFWDLNEGGFFDTDGDVLGVRLKGIEDIPHPSSNALGIILLLKLYSITEKKFYYDHAEAAIKIFTQLANEMGTHAGYFFCAIDTYFRMLKITLHTKRTSKLAKIALSAFHPHMTIIHGKDKGYVIPCFQDVCAEPINSTDSLEDFFLKQKTHT